MQKDWAGLYRILDSFKGIIALELTCSQAEQRHWMGYGAEGDVSLCLRRLVERVSYVVRLDPPDPESSEMRDLWKICLEQDTKISFDSRNLMSLAKASPHFTIGRIRQSIRQARAVYGKVLMRPDLTTERQCMQGDARAASSQRPVGA